MRLITPAIVSAFLLIFIGIVTYTVANWYYQQHSLTNSVPKVMGATNSNTPTSHSLIPLVSNLWYSNLFVSFPSQPLYALPLVYKVSSGGLGISYPTVRKTPNTIFGSYDEDMIIGINSPFIKSSIKSIGDWNIIASLSTSKNETLSFGAGHGIPYSVIHFSANTATISFKNSASVYQGKSTQLITGTRQVKDIRIVTNNSSYIVSFPPSQSITVNKQSITIAKPSVLFVGLLDKGVHYDEFVAASDNNVIDTQANPSIDNGKLYTQFRIKTSKDAPTLIALYPHQFDNLTSPITEIGTYETIRGTLHLVKTNSFKTAIQLTTPPGKYKVVSDTDHLISNQVKKDIQSYIQGGPPNSKNYFLGAWFGKGSNLLLLADTFGLTNERQQLLNYISPLFTKSLSNFSYDANKTSVIAKYPEFGNEKFNDHHFHYGYFIRTAAVLANYDFSSVDRNKEMINQMVSDIATTDRASTKYPYLRNFDVYEGHSWADGLGHFADGTNQESSSEAINAWYGTYLWSQVTKDFNLEQYSLYLLNSEIHSAYYYWFGNNKVYMPPYGHAIASIVWGGKVDYATWFSPETNMKYGIQLLPFSPVSTYLGGLENFDKYDKDFKASGGSEKKEWGDLYIMWKSFYKPKDMIQYKNTSLKGEGNNPRSLYMYYLQYNLENSKYR